MKTRESGMPDETYWESLFAVELILDRLGIDKNIRDVVELGCGYGTFTIPVAKRIGGSIVTHDIESAMVERTTQRAFENKTSNVVCRLRDVVKGGFDVPENHADACLLFNILHAENPGHLLAEAARIVRENGKILVIHWRRDNNSPRGPSMDIRPAPEQIIEWAVQTNVLALDSDVIDLPPWHYGLRFTKKLTV